MEALSGRTPQCSLDGQAEKRRATFEWRTPKFRSRLLPGLSRPVPLRELRGQAMRRTVPGQRDPFVDRWQELNLRAEQGCEVECSQRRSSQARWTQRKACPEWPRVQTRWQ